MANLGPTSTEITLTPSYGSSSPSTPPMPRATQCGNCGRQYAEHPEGKCLFDSSQFRQEDLSVFKSRFEAWANGQRLEDCLAQIVYNLTKVTP